MKLSEFNQKYIYTPDKTLDNWQVLKPVDGFYRGDCEDYCLTLKAKVDGFEGLELYYCKYDGVGHCIGKLGDMWIDCGLQRLVASLPPVYTDIRKYWKIEILFKKLLDRLNYWMRG